MVRTASTPALILGLSAVSYIAAALFLRYRLNSPSLDVPLYGTFFVVAHLHPFLVGAFICAMFALIYLAAPQLSQAGIRKWLTNFHAFSMAAVPFLMLVAILIPIYGLPPYGSLSPGSQASPGSRIEPLVIVGIFVALLLGNAAFVCASIIALVKRTE